MILVTPIGLVGAALVLRGDEPALSHDRGEALGEARGESIVHVRILESSFVVERSCWKAIECTRPPQPSTSLAPTMRSALQSPPFTR